MRYVIGLVSLLVTPFYIWAAGETAQTITVDGTLYDSTNYTNPLLDSNVLLTIQILDPTKACILYEEQQTVDTSTTNGQFNIQVGSEPGNAKRVAVNDPNHDMATILQNVTPMSTDVGCGGTYTPASRDERYLRITVDPTVGGPETMVPDLTISAVPNALVAESVQGLDKNKIAEFGTHIHANMTPTNLLNLFDGSDVGGGLHNHDALYARLNASSSITLGLQETVGLGQFTTAQQTTLTGGLNGTTDVGKMWVNSTTNKVMYWDGTQAVDVAQVGGDFESDGSVPMSGALNLNGQNAINSGHITMNAQMYIQLGRFDNTQEAALAATPLTVAHRGVTIFNTDSNVMKYWNGAAFVTVGGGTMNDVVDDTTPQLGGNLDLNSNSLTSATAFPITTGSSAGHDLTVNTNQLVVEGDTGRVGIGTATPSQALDVVGNIAVSGTVDGIDIATDVAANTAKVTNATHTGDVTGSGALTIDPSAVSGKTTVTAVATDMVLLWDATDSQLKKADVNDFMGAGGSMNDVVDDTTPQLGGNLDVNGNNFTSATGMDFAIGGAAGNDFTVDTNKLVVEGDTGRVGIGTATPSQALDVVGNIAVSGTVDGIDIATDVAANTAKVTNATHTGDVTGSGALAIDPSAISGKTTVTAVATDMVLLWDATDSQLKKADVNDFMTGGGSMNDVVDDTTPQLGGNLDLNSNSLTSAAAFPITTGSSAGHDLTINTNQLVVEGDTGNVGVGTAAPTSALDLDGAVTMQEISAPAVSASGDGRIYFDSTAKKFRVSENGGAYTDLLGGGGITDVISDATPQLGGQLDVNGQALGDGTLELMTFSETASAVNQLNVTNAATGNGPTLSAAGDDTNIDLILDGKGTGQVVLTSSDLNITGNIVVSGTVDGIDIATDVAANTAKVTNATHTGDVTGSGALTIANTAITGKTTVTGASGDFVLISDTSDSGNLKKVDVNDFMGGGGSMNDVVDDTTPQLGGQLDVNGQAIGSGTEELIAFSEAASAVNEITVSNAATGNGPSVAASGDDTNIDLILDGKGTGQVVLTSSDLNITGDIVVSGTVDGIDIATDVAANTAKVTNATHTGDVTGSGALAIDPSAISGKTTVTAVATDMVLLWDATDSQLKKADVNDFMGAGGSMNDVVDDTTPQLGGNLDVNGNNFTSAAGMDFAIGGAAGNDFTVDTNKLVVEGDTGRVGIGTATPSQALDVVGNIAVSGTVDGIDIATDVAANTAKVTNATHTGDVTGSGALTIDPSAISGKTTVTAVATDMVLLWDATDSQLKKADVNDFIGGGGSMNDVVDDTTPQLGGNLDLNSNSLTSAAAFPITTGSSAGHDLTINTNQLVVEGDTGNVGIGSAAPTSALDLTGAITLQEIAAPAVSAAGDGRIYFDSTAKKFRVSENNGAYVDLVGGGGSMNDVVDDTTPQLGGQLDVNGQALGDGTLELMTFSETASAVNQLNVTNAATGNGPTLSAAGDDTNIDLVLDGKGTGQVVLSSSDLNVTGNIVVSGTVDGIDIATDVAANTAKVTNATHTGDVTGSGALTIDPSAISGKTTVTAVATDMVLLWDATDSQLKKADANDFLGAGGSMNDVVDDTTPQLGGNLDLNSNSLTSAAAFPITTGSSAGHDLTVNTNQLVVEGDTGRVGIGTATPSQALDVVGNIAVSGTVDGIDIATDVAANTAKVTNATHTGDVTGSGALTIDPSAISGKTTVTAVATDMVLLWDATDSQLKKADVNDFIGGGGSMNDVVDDTTPQLGGNLDVNGNNFTSAAGMDFAIGGAAGNDFTVDTDKLVIEGDTGNAGIGTATPDYELEIYKAQDADTTLEIHNPNNTGSSEAQLLLNAGGSLGQIRKFSASSGSETLQMQNQENIQISAYGASSSILLDTNGGNRLTIDSSGNVGIGVTSPSTKIDVDGAINMQEMAAPAVSAAGDGRIYFDSTAKKFRVSENNGAYVDLVGSSGAAALDGLTDGNTSWGTNSLLLGTTLANASITSSDTLAIGTDSLNALTSGNNNISIGHGNLKAIDSESNNLAIGHNSGSAMTTGSRTIIIGNDAFDAATNVNNSVVVGASAGGFAPGMQQSVAIGAYAMGYYSSGTPAEQVAVGHSALSQSEQSYNTGVGAESLGSLDQGFSNTALGRQAGRAAVGGDGSFNVFLGAQTGTAYTDADYNIFIGYRTGDTTTTGDNNLIIGPDLETSTATVSNELNIGALIHGTGLDATGTAIASGNIGIGVRPAQEKLEVAGGLALAEMTAPTTDVAGYHKLYVDTADNHLKYRNESGTVVNLSGGGGGSMNDVVDDTTPQLGGQLDVNGQALGDGTLELITFSETASAVNQINVTNAATGNGPILSAAGDDTNIDLVLDGKGTGQVVLTSSDLNITGDIVVSGTVDGIDIATDVAANTAKVTNATHTGDVTGSGALTIDPSAISGKTTVTAVATDMVLLWDATDSQLKKADVNDFIGGGGSMNDVVDDTTPQLGGNLDVNGNNFTSAAGMDFAIGGAAGNDFTVDTDKLVIEGDTGNAGIGTATPDYELEIYKAQDADTTLEIHNPNNTGSSEAQLLLNAGGSLGQIRKFSASSGSETLQMQNQENIQISAYGASSSILLDTNGGNRLTIDSSGNVGIGVTSPSTKIDVDGAINMQEMAAPAVSAAGDGRIYFDSTAKKFRVSENNGAYVDLVGGGGGGTLDQAYDAGSATVTVDGTGGGDVIWNLTSTDDFKIQDNSTDAFVVTDGGLVGVGTNSPGGLLTVQRSSNSATEMQISALGVSNNQQANLSLVTLSNNSWLGQAANKGWIIGARGNAHSNATQQNDLRIIYWDGSSYTNAIHFDSATGNIGFGMDLPTSTLDLGGAFTLQEMVAPAVSASGDGRIYFDSTSKTFKVSEDGGAYVDLVGGGSMNDVVDDTTPQLGGQLDVNGQALGDGTLELITFSETASAVNQINVTNAATGNGPILSAAGDDTNIDLVLDGKGTGQVVLTSSDLNITGDIVVSGTVDGIDIATDVAANTAKVTNATHTGDVTGSGALTIANTAITGKTTVTGASGDFVLISDTSDSGNLKKVDVNDFMGGGSMNDVVDDTTPQLGGNLDLNSNSLTSAAAFPITTGSSAGNDFTINTNQLVVEGDTGNVGIGTATPGSKFEVNGDITADAYLFTSDARKKENVKTVKRALEKVLELRGVTFDWIASGEADIGLIAQEVEAVLPDLVNTNEDSGMKSVKYANLVAYLIEAIKEMQQEYDERISSLEKENEDLNNRVERLEALVEKLVQER